MSTINPAGRYGMYLRRSRADVEEEKRGAGETLARHYTMLTDLARRMGVVISDSAVYREIVSGDTLAERPEAQRMLADVEKRQWDGIFTADVDRLARGDTMDQGLVAQTFLYSNTLIITPYKIYDPADPSDREFFEMKLFFARREYDQIKRRLQTGRVAAAAEGLYLGSRPPYGYRRVKLPDRKGWSLEIIPDEAAVVRMVFDWYLHGLDGENVGTVKIAQRLHEMGLRTNRGCEWTDNAVAHLLKNPLYIGMISWNKRVQVTEMKDGQRVKTRRPSDKPVFVPGLHAPLVSRADFDAAQRLLVERRKSPARTRRGTAFVFAGLLKCGVCGRAMIRNPNSSRRAEYDIAKCSNQRCSCSGITITVLEDVVLHTLEGWRLSASGDAGRDPAAPTAEDAARAELAATLRAELATLGRQLSRLRDLLEQGVYSVDVYLERQRELSERMADTADRLNAMDKPAKPSIDDAIRAELPKIENVLQAYRSAQSPAEKNQLLKSVISRITYTKTQKTPPHGNPLDYLHVDVYPNMDD